MAAFEIEWAQYQTFIAANLNTNTLQASPAQFTFTTINLKVAAFEFATYDLDPTSPVATDDSFTTNEDMAVDIDLLFNDADGNNQDLRVTKIDGQSIVPGGSVAVEGGTVSMAADGTLTFTPDANFSGTISFEYTVSDTDNLTDTGVVNITVTAVADAPSLTVMDASGNEDSAIPLSISASLNDTDGSETLSITITGVPAGAVLSAGTDNGGGSWTLTAAQLAGLTITPPDDSDGDFTLTVTATATETNGGDTESTVDTIEVTVNDVPDANNAVNDKLVISSGTIATFSTTVLTANDFVPLQVVAVSGDAVTAGVVVLNAATQTFTYNTTGVGAGGLSFNYTLSDGSTGTVTFDVVNANPGYDLSLLYSAPNSYQGSYLDAGGGGDDLDGEAAPDILVGGSGNDTLNGGSGGDILRGGTGDDTLNGQGDAGQFDLIDLSDSTTVGVGITFNLVQSSSQTTVNLSSIGLSSATGDKYQNMEGVIGTKYNDTLNGSILADELRGGDGNDTINGNDGNDILKGDAGVDTISGGNGNDLIFGGAGADILSGGANDDIFSYLSKLDAGDTISDFRSSGLDQLDLSAIDANELLANDQDFVWGGDDGPIANGLWFSYNAGTNTTTLSGDTNGDMTADFTLTLLNFNGFVPYSDPLSPPPDQMVAGVI